MATFSLETPELPHSPAAGSLDSIPNAESETQSAWFWFDLTPVITSLMNLSFGLVAAQFTTDKYLRHREDKEEEKLNPNSQEMQTIPRVTGTG